jgi:outer membrane lipoprotein-sorting protein
VVRAALLVVVLAVASACQTVLPAVPLAPDDPRPAALLARWAADLEARRGLRGRARLAVASESGDVRLRARQILVLERPARLRVEVLGLMNQTAAVIATDGNRYQIFRATDRSFEAGIVDPDLLWREARIGLRPEEAIAVLLGVPTPAPGLSPANAVMRDGERIGIDLVDAGGVTRQRAEFDAAERLRAFEELTADGSVRWRVRFDDYRKVGEATLPHGIALDVTAGGIHADIELRDIELNPDLPVELFRLRAPAGEAAGAGEAG